MKNVLLNISFLIIPLLSYVCQVNESSDYGIHFDAPQHQATELSASETNVKLINIHDVIASVESKGNPKAVGSANSVGYLQIRPTLVQDVNKILRICGKKERYSHKDALSKQKSIEMFRTYTDFYLNHYNKPKTVDNICALWNSGPQMSMNKTNHYRDRIWKVVKRYERKGFLIEL